MAKLSSELLQKWEHIIEDVEMTNVPIEFMRKLVLKLNGRKQRTINIETLLRQGFDPDEIEETINRKMSEMDDEIISVEFILNVESIADAIQPETDKILRDI